MATPRSHHYTRATSGPIGGGLSVFAASAFGQAVAAGALGVTPALAGVAAGSAVADGSLSKGANLSAAAVAQAAAAAAAAIGKAMGGTAGGVAAAGGAMTVSAGGGGSGAIALLYTDITEGPKTGGQNGNGVPVTLFGNGFGASRGAGTVTLGGGAVASYVSWSDTKIVVELGSAVASGNFVVTNNAGQSATGCLSKPYGDTNDFSVRTGSILFVSTGGSGSGTFASPLGPAQVYANCAAGNTLIFRGGTYTAEMGGSGWGAIFAIGNSHGGTSGNRLQIVGYPGETVTFDGATGGVSRCIRLDDSTDTKGNYVTVANITLRAVDTCTASGAYGALNEDGAVGYRLVNSDLRCTYTGNTLTGIVHIGGDGARILGCVFHDTGGSTVYNNNHATYIAAGADDVEVAWNLYRDLRMGYVIQNHMDAGSVGLLVYTNIRIHHNEIYLGATGDCRGITCSDRANGSIAYIYGNILGPGIGQATGAIVVWSAYAEIYNNLCYQPSGGCIVVNSTFHTIQGVIAKNNILVSNGSDPYFNGLAGGNVTPGAANFTVDNNLYFGNGSGPAADTHAINANPLFTNAAARDFTLQTGSPGRNAGTSAVNGIFAFDRNGILRPQGAAWDVGPYEATS